MSILSANYDIEIPRVRDLIDMKPGYLLTPYHLTSIPKRDRSKLRQMWAIVGKNYKLNNDSFKVISQQLWKDFDHMKSIYHPSLGTYAFNIVLKGHKVITFSLYERTQ